MRLMIGEYTLRPIREEDLSLVLKWRNSDKIRLKMFQQHIIEWAEHKKWFERIKTKKIPMNFIFEYMNKPIGYAAVSDYDIENKSCSSGKYIGEDEGFPVDAGIVLGYLLDVYMYDVLKVETAIGSTLKNNKRVLKQNLKGARIIKTDENTVWFAHDKKEWARNKLFLGSYIGEDLIIEV